MRAYSTVQMGYHDQYMIYPYKHDDAQQVQKGVNNKKTYLGGESEGKEKCRVMMFIRVCKRCVKKFVPGYRSHP